MGQNHDSKFFNHIDALLTEPMRFTGPIYELSLLYRDAIKAINEGYVVDKRILNVGTNRQNSWDYTLNTGYKFTKNVYELVEQVADEIKSNPDDMNYSRMLAFKNKTVNILNTSVREYIYGKNCAQFEENEIVISNGGFVSGNVPLIHNGMLLRIDGAKEIMGPYDIPCYGLKFKDSPTLENVQIPVVRNTPEAKQRYESIKSRLKAYAVDDKRQWYKYYRFIEEFAYFDYTSAVSLYKSQGQTLKNVYVFEGEVMDVKPLSLKQKYQALYVAMTRATSTLNIYNKNY